MGSLLIEMLQALLTFDLVWWFSLIMHNLHFLFIFVLLSYYFFDGKNTVRWFFIFVLYVLGSVGFWATIGWGFLAGSFFIVAYTVRLSLATFANDMPSLKDRLPLVLSIQFLVILVLYNIGFFG